MDFSQKYHLVELLPGEGVESYRARQRNTGRDVTVHLLVGGKTPGNDALLVRLRAMEPQSMAKLIEVGEYQGSTFVVTVAPPYQRLDEWLVEQERVTAAAKEFGKAGIWKRPEVGSLVPPGPQPAQAPPGPGAFTKQFQRPAAPAPELGLPATSPAGAAAEVDEFAKLFAAPPVSAATTQFTPAPPQPPVSPAATTASEQGEFTRMFQSPVGPPPAPPPPPAHPVATTASKPGDFTRMFQNPVAPPPAPLLQPPVNPPTTTASEQGEFTRMFQSPVGPPPAPPPPPAHPVATPASGPGDFTRMFQNPVAAPPAPPPLQPPVSPPATTASEPGEFTRMFQSPPAPPPPPQVSAAATPGAGPGEFTRMFHSPMPDAPAQGDWPPPAAKPQEPGAFTQMFQAPPAARQDAGPPPAKGGEFTEFFKPSPGGMAAGPQFPAASQFPKAAAAPTPPPPQQESGEYTRMFGPAALSGAPGPVSAAPAAAPPLAPPTAYAPGGSATQAFRVAPGSAPAATPQGPSEYTRMISVPSNPGPPPPGALPVAPPPAGQMPGMPQMPSMALPAAPQPPAMPQMAYTPPAMPQVAPPPVTVPPVSAPEGKSSNTLLIVIFCLLAFLLGGIVVYLLVRHG